MNDQAAMARSGARSTCAASSSLPTDCVEALSLVMRSAGRWSRTHCASAELHCASCTLKAPRRVKTVQEFSQTEG